MPTLRIGDKDVKVGDEFLKLSPTQQAMTVNEIADSIGANKPQEEKSFVSSLGDFFKSGGRGIVKGAIGLAGLPGDFEAGVKSGLDKILPLPAGAEPHGLIPPPPTSSQIESGVEKIAGKFDEPQTTAGKYAQSVGEFIPSAVIGPGGLATKAATTLAGGIGSESAGEVAEGTGAEPYARFAGGLLGGAGAGLASAESKAAQLSRRLPTIDQLKQGGTAAYEAVKNARLKATPESVDRLVSDTKKSLDDDLIVDVSAPRTFKALDKLQAAGGDIAQLMGIRQKLNEIGPQEGTEYAAASHAKQAIDHYIDTLDPKDVVQGDPKFTQALLQEARADWRSYKKADEVEQAQAVAKHRSMSTGSGANEQNALRQEFRKILDSDKRSRGYSPEAKAQMEKIVNGTWLANKARHIGKYAPSGPVSASTSILAGLGLGPATGAAVGIGGFLAKRLGTYLTKRQIRDLADLVRKESPIGRPIARQNEAEKPNYGAILPAAATRSVAALPRNISEDVNQNSPPL
jgi:hypothetical protein